VLSLPPSVRLFVAREPVDMRKAIDGLSGVVRDVLTEDPMSGHLFIFFNKRSNRVKILWWDRSGFWLLLKRLEEGRFKLPALKQNESTKTLRVTASELALVLDGIERVSVREPLLCHRNARDDGRNEHDARTSNSGRDPRVGVEGAHGRERNR
jgi:transposase